MSGMRAFGSVSWGTFNSSTMIVMMTAITPSLNASSRPLVMRRSPVLAAAEYVLGSFPVQAGKPLGDRIRHASSSMNGEGRDACRMRSFEVCKNGRAQHRRLRGMPRCRRHLGPSSPVPGVRARRLLRQLEEQARHQAFKEDRASDHHLARAGGGLELVLRRRDRHGALMNGKARVGKRLNLDYF